MRLITKREVIKSVARRWYDYHWSRVDGWSSYKDEDTYKQLISLDLSEASAEVVERLTGAGWVTLRCDGCGQTVESVVEIGEEPFDYESAEARICCGCLNKAISVNEVRPPSWKDTSENKLNKAGRPVSSFDLDTGELYISITNGHIFAPDGWVVHCRRIGIDTRSLVADVGDADAAKAEAIAVVLQRLDDMKNSILKK